MSRSNQVLLVVVSACFLSVLLGVSAICLGLGARTTPIPVPPQPPRASEGLQKVRLEFVESMIQKGTIYKLEMPGSVPRVYVLHPFYLLNHEDKQSLMNICFAYSYAIPQGRASQPDQFMRIIDARSGKQVGDFTQRGLSPIDPP